MPNLRLSAFAAFLFVSAGADAELFLHPSRTKQPKAAVKQQCVESKCETEKLARNSGVTVDVNTAELLDKKADLITFVQTLMPASWVLKADETLKGHQSNIATGDEWRSALALIDDVDDGVFIALNEAEKTIGIAATKAAATAIAKRSPLFDAWHISAGGDLRSNLESWAGRAGYQLVWKVSNGDNVELDNQITLHGALVPVEGESVSALGTLFDSLEKSSGIALSALASTATATIVVENAVAVEQSK